MQARSSCPLSYCILLLSMPVCLASLCQEHERQFGDNDCQCQAGYSRRAGVCTPCPFATFKEYAGDRVEHGPACAPGMQSLSEGCCACRPNTITLAVASVHSSACVCVPGYGGAACLPCALGSYKSAMSMAECDLCPPGATTLLFASTAASRCVAMRGYYGSIEFSQCPPGSYTAIEGMQQCEPCPLGATSPPGATGKQQCQCTLEGFLPSAGGCTCQPGYARGVDDLCVLCPPGFYCPGDEKAPQPCPKHSSAGPGASHNAQCVCDAGHSGDDGGTCVACAAGLYKKASGSAACSTCAENAASAPGSTECLCLPGHDGAECTPCAAGSYKATLGNVPCQPCPSHMSSLPGSTSVAQCSCLPRFVLAAGICTACAHNTYQRNNTCVPCPSDDDLYCMCAAGVDNEGACGQCMFSRDERPCAPECEPGQERVHGECVPCREGYFKSAARGQCERCPAVLSSSPRGSVSESECTCPPNTLEVASEDMSVVRRLGEWLPDSVEEISAMNVLLHKGAGMWRLLVQGSLSTVTVTVAERLVFECVHTCAHTTLELAGMRGALNASAPGALLTLLVRTRRAVLLEAERPWWQAAEQRAQTWAAQGVLRPGFAVFRTRRVFTGQQCSPCPANLVCA